MPRERQDRAYGPFEHGKRWRVVLVGADGRRTHASESDEGPRGFATFAAAKAYVDSFAEVADARTVGGALDEYLAHLRARGLKDSSVTTTRHRLRGLLRVVERDRALRSLTPQIARGLIANRTTKRGKKPATDTQVGELAAARGFAEWCVKRGWLRSDPFAELEVEGQRAAGKPQLRIEEARKFLDTALAEGGQRGVAAALALVMGMRASEVTNRVVRDVDDGARVLWISRGKNRRADRHLEIPEVLRAPIAALCAGRGGGEPLFGDVDRHWLAYHVRRLCRVAKLELEVSPHGLRGTQASISVRAVSVEHVAAALGQDPRGGVTRRHYLAAGAEQDGRQRAALRAIAGGAA